MSTLTPAQRGIKLRLAASRERSAGHDDTADMIDDLADKLDPRPEYPDGLYCWQYPEPYSTTAYVRRSGGRWLDAFGVPDDELEPPEKCTRVRVLGDDEIAVKRVPYLDDWEISQTRLYGGELRSCGNARHLAAARLVENYADALEAEAGER